MSHRLMRIARLVMVTGSAIALSAPIAFGQSLPKPPQKYDWNSRWRGSATCVVTGHSPSHSDYTNQEIHKWEISPISYAFDDVSGLRKWYWASWTVTGSGRFGHFSWTTNGGYAWTVLQFWVPSLAAPGIGSTMNIAEIGGGAFDIHGTIVRNETDGTLSEAWVYELPFPTIVAAPGSTISVQGNSSTTINGSIFFDREEEDWSPRGKEIKEPDDGINVVTCSWDFEYSPLLLTPFKGKLCLPSMPDCDSDKPFVLKPPPKKPE